MGIQLVCVCSISNVLILPHLKQTLTGVGPSFYDVLINQSNSCDRRLIGSWIKESATSWNHILHLHGVHDIIWIFLSHLMLSDPIKRREL